MLLSLPLVLFLSSFIFSFIISTQLIDSVAASLLFNIILLTVSLLLIQYCRKNTPSDHFAYYVILLMAIVQFTIPLVYTFVDGPAFMVWTTDSYDHHIHNSIIVSDYINNNTNLPEWDNPFKKIFLSNWWIGFWYALFGPSPYVTAIATSMLRLPTCYLVYKSSLLFSQNRSHASIALIIYSFSPTVIFYTLQYYKDFLIQLIVAILLYFLLQSRSRPVYLIYSMLALFFLFYERFYLALIFSVVLAVMVMSSAIPKQVKIIAVAIPLLLFIVFFQRYFSGQSFSAVLESLFEFQDAHNSDPSVTPVTNIFVDFIRASLTPFFSFQKVDNYLWFDSLLIFGSFVHQAVMLFYLRGLWSFRRYRLLGALNLSVFLLILLVGFVFPYNGRARDSVYPIIAMTAALGIIPKSSLSFRASKGI